MQNQAAVISVSCVDLAGTALRVHTCPRACLASASCKASLSAGTANLQRKPAASVPQALASPHPRPSPALGEVRPADRPSPEGRGRGSPQGEAAAQRWQDCAPYVQPQRESQGLRRAGDSRQQRWPPIWVTVGDLNSWAARWFYLRQGRLHGRLSPSLKGSVTSLPNVL